MLKGILRLCRQLNLSSGTALTLVGKSYFANQSLVKGQTELENLYTATSPRREGAIVPAFGSRASARLSVISPSWRTFQAEFLENPKAIVSVLTRSSVTEVIMTVVYVGARPIKPL